MFQINILSTKDAYEWTKLPDKTDVYSWFHWYSRVRKGGSISKINL